MTMTILCDKIGTHDHLALFPALHNNIQFATKIIVELRRFRDG